MKYLALLILLFVFLTPQSVRAATLTRPTNNLGLRAYWSFDEGTGLRANDRTGFKNTGTLSGSVVPAWVSGKYGKALSFDGSTSYVEVPDSESFTFGTSPVSISAWVNFNSGGMGVYQGIVSQGIDSFELNKSGGNTLRLEMKYADGTNKRGETAVNTLSEPNTWYFVVGIFEPATGTFTFYINGQQSTTFYVDSQAGGTLKNSTSPVQIGRRGSAQLLMNGEIDELKIYGRVLSPAEVASMYRAGQSSIKNVARTGLVGEWKFDEGVGTTAHNSTNYSTRATLVNGATWTTGKHGRAVQLDGNNQYATIPGSTELNISSVTTAFWFTLTADPECDAGNNYRMLFNKLSGVTGWRVVLEQDKSVQFDVGIGGVSSRSGGRSVGMRVGVPVFLAFTYDAATGDQKIWANGALVYTKANTPAPMDVNSSPFTIGAGGSAGTCPSSGNGFVPGIYDDVRIYNRALSADELYALYKERAVAVNSSQNTKMTNGLIGMWSFNGADVVGTTTVTDGSGNGNNGTIVGTPQRVAGKLGQAFWFTGNQYITTTVAPPSAAYTKTAWVKLTATNCSGSNNIISSSGSATAFWAASSNSCKLAAGHNNSWTQVMDATPLVQKTWYFVSVTYDSTVAGGTLTLYKDGVVVSSATGISAPPNTAAVIGGHNGGNYMVGIIDEARLYNRALSASEIKQLYLMGK